MSMEIIYLKPGELTPYAKNAKKHPADQVEHIANSIREFGFRQPIVIDADNVVVIGHGRLLAAKKLGLDTVPCVRADDLTDAQINALRLADNKTNESEWDMELLGKELSELFNDIDMRQFGFDDIFPDDEDEVVEDYPPAIPEESVTKRGEIYQLGDHRLMCGDSTDINDVYALMGGYYADLLLTDPPYNVDYTGGTKEALKIMNDSMCDSAFRAFLTDAFSNANEVMNPGAAYYIWHADSEGLNFRIAVRSAGWQLRQCLVWVKNSIVLGRQDYQWKHEPCLYGWKAGTHYFTDDRSQPTVIDDKIDIKKLKKPELLALLEQMLSTNVPTTVLYEDKPLVNDIHPTMKPVRLMAQLIKNSTKPEQLVLDLFGGSGSTMMACEQLHRKCFTMELDPRYCDAIIQRWEDFTGDKAVKVNGGEE